ncbi:PTS lactose/cellobiose transporter subunit IIA [Loigolactobacillus iwatensis]|uniref:PTS lactose/cellobiose transporter subunit IIA n=1 Tax=Loigolactobacillus iwatensis TaxID=1267156 RepID=UPI000F7DE772|nr:PTS lactose/cellobiose transporter subunit IIA [Loigolactobacillus iwatensis]
MMETKKNDVIESVMALINDAATIKAIILAAIEDAKKNQFTAATTKLEEADKKLVAAHEIQTHLLSQEAAGQKIQVTLLLVHAQDHIMSVSTYRDLASEIIDLYRRLAETK